MKTFPACLAGAFALGAAFSSLAQTPAAHAHEQSAAAIIAGPQADVASAAQAAVAVVDAFGKALRAGDLKSAGDLLAADVLILESGGVEHSREEYLAHHAIGDAKFLKGSHSQLKSRRARIDGELAWVGTESELHVSENGKPLTYLSTETMVLKRDGADWRIVHIHWSSRPKR